MRYLLDTGILLRVVNRADPLHASVRDAVRTLKAQGHATVAAPQNIAEFWNVCTRPSLARGGLGLTPDEAQRRLGLIERIVQILPDHPAAYGQWKVLVTAHAVMGVQVHDARLVAFMLSHGINHLLTLNAAGFARYQQLAVATPQQVTQAAAGGSPPP
jgi:predicted nucleic acid-binding protein